VIVEYNTDAELYVNNTLRTPFSTVESQLVVDEVVGDVGKGKLGGFKGVSYMSIEHDRVTVPKVIPTAVQQILVQSQTLKINGFNNKTIGRMLIQKAPTEPTSYKNGTQLFHFGKTASKCSNKEKLQIRVNGSSLIAGKGITGDNQRLAMLNDVWGNMSICPFEAGTAFMAGDDSTTDVRQLHIVTGNPSISNADYYGLNINNKVEDLQIDYERQGIYLYTTESPTVPATDVIATGLSDNNQALNLNIFCEVMKQIIPTANGYNVIYV